MKRTALKRKTPLRTRRWRKQKTDTVLAQLFRRIVLFGPRGDGLAQCYAIRWCNHDEHDWFLDPAHIIPAGTLRKHGFSEAVVYDPRNGIPLCRRHHRRNDLAIERIPREFIPQRTLDFAAELGLSHLIDRLYGEDPSTRKGMDRSA